ncbi:guanylate cyclase [Achlya hypogyna]|uniref:Guanylate cyclase n=1 Tax=Achlya hypogyna TaxID=1202772 RepID=A0A1V9YEA3_ACHHY|nr:guanylate cyclase [Achlya hypogyna]
MAAAPLSAKSSTRAIVPTEDKSLALKRIRSLFEGDDFSMDDIALHFLSLHFMRLSTNAVLSEVESLFAEHYAMLQQKLHIRGIWAWIIFLSGTVLYDYVSLIEGYGNIFTTDIASFSNPNAKVAFFLTLVLRFAVVIPLLLVNLWSGYRAKYVVHMRVTWASHVALAIYPVAYNLLTFDFGVSWLCLVIMYFYSFTPIRFLHAAIFNAFLLGVYAAFAYGGVLQSDMIDTFQREWLWALLFYALISYPRYLDECTSLIPMMLPR